jgi:hypothetical protein
VLVRRAQVKRDDEFFWGSTLWLIGTLPSSIAAAALLAEPVLGTRIAASISGIPLYVGSPGGLLLFGISAFSAPRPARAYLWLSVRVAQIGAWAGGCFMAFTRILDV